MPEKFIVPQFIDKEDQILGPVTVRQFLIMLVAVFTIFIANRILAFPYFIVYTIFAGSIGGVFGFLKINGTTAGKGGLLWLIGIVQTGAACRCFT